MEVETYRATLKHDKGIIRLKVVSLSGEEGAIKQIVKMECCPESAIVNVVKIGSIVF